MSQIVDKAARINIALPQRHGVPLKTRGKRPFACRASYRTLVIQALMKASRSSFTWLLSVVHKPCEAPL